MTKPLLPSSDRLLPYLQRIDKSRVYCNFGELNTEYESRLSEMFGSTAVTCSSATAGLVAALLALELPKGSLIACPSWTFAATACAILMAGHEPYFLDVGNSGILREATIASSPCAAAIVVAPCGAPLGRYNVSIPIIVDAAGGFDTVKNPEHTTVISTHATKPFGTGEGGFVLCPDKKMAAKIRNLTNFGFDTSRQIEVAGLNGKLSEYHAAVGLASLDEWPEKRELYLRKTKMHKLNYVTSLVAIQGGEGRKNVYGLHTQKAFSKYKHLALTVTEHLMKKLSFVSVTL